METMHATEFRDQTGRVPSCSSCGEDGGMLVLDEDGQEWCRRCADRHEAGSATVGWLALVAVFLLLTLAALIGGQHVQHHLDRTCAQGSQVACALDGRP